MAAASDFRALEAHNRRETATLVAAFLAIFAVLGLGLDFLSQDLRIVDRHLAGFPLLTIGALIFAGIRSLVSFYGGASLVL